MTKDKKQYVCSACGSVQLKWSGKCPDCGEWNTLEEEIVQAPEKARPAAAGVQTPGQPVPLTRSHATTCHASH